MHEQCVQSAKKAQSVLGMVKRHFKKIDQDDFTALYNTYIRPHLDLGVLRAGMVATYTRRRTSTALNASNVGLQNW